MKRWLALLLMVSFLALVGGALRGAPEDEEPVRLKKKKSIVPKVPTGDSDQPARNENPKAEKKPAVPTKEKPEGETGPSGEEAEERELLERIARNIKVAEERLANRELGDATRQVQQDILKDIDSLIKKADSPSDGGQGGGGDSSQEQGKQGEESKGKGATKAGSGRSTGPKSIMRRGRQSARMSARQGPSQQAQGNQGGAPKNRQGSARDDSPKQGPDGKNSQAGKEGGSAEGPRNPTADLYKDAWGHLPASLRAEMDAYFNNKQFMVKYDDLIKRYYSAIAEKSRPKGK